MVDPSPWPFIASVGAFVMALGAIGFMKYAQGTEFVLLGLDLTGWGLFAIGLLIVLYVMFGWWRDTVRESAQGSPTPRGGLISCTAVASIASSFM